MNPDPSASAPAPATSGPDRVDEISADLAYDLQFRSFEQLTNIGVGGAGLTITLVGGVLKHSGFYVWIAAVEFGLAGLIALVAQSTLIEHLFARRPVHKRARLFSMIAIVLVGMGIGSLATSVFLG